jgi:hypothetical protein
MLGAALAALGLLFALVPARSLAANPCSPPVNKIACENQQTGDDPGDWQTQGAGDPSIQGYATSMSVNVGQVEKFKIKTDSTDYHIDILRLGYYGGDGARKVYSDLPITASLPQVQPACTNDGASANPTGLIDCGNWGVTAQWTVPSNAVSGVYIAHLVRDDQQGGDSQIPTWSCRPPTRPGRRTTRTAATACTRARSRARRARRTSTRAPTPSPTTARSTARSRRTTAARTSTTRNTR